MSIWDSDHDCLNCGLSLYGETPASFPFCDELCERTFEQRRALRKMKFDLYRWNARARWSLIIAWLRTAKRGPVAARRNSARSPRSRRGSS